MTAFCISATASRQGKTLLTTALLWHFRGRVRPFKIGPDFIDPQFHKSVCGTDAVNLDTFIMNAEQVVWLFEHYATEKVAILEGVMGYYDGEDKGCSTYSVAKLLGIPTLLVLDGSGSYITLSAVLKGMITYRNDHTVGGVILNKIASVSHYALIKKQLRKDHPNLRVFGWIHKDLPALRETHLGLDLVERDRIGTVAQSVLEHLDMAGITALKIPQPKQPKSYPFPPIRKRDQRIAIVHDANFSFLYYDNMMVLREMFSDVFFVDATRDETIPPDTDFLYIPGGYVESDAAYSAVQHADRFRNSLIRHAAAKPVYAECAGLLYLANRVDDKTMAGVLDVDFVLHNRPQRLGYYYDASGIRGHAFHYTAPTEASCTKGFGTLSKTPGGDGRPGSWKSGTVYGTYLHTMFRAFPYILIPPTQETT